MCNLDMWTCIGECLADLVNDITKWTHNEMNDTTNKIKAEIEKNWGGVQKRGAFVRFLKIENSATSWKCSVT